MDWSQKIVLTTAQFVAVAAVLLCGARIALFWVRQPVARIRLIHFTLTAVFVAMLLMAFSPWTALRLPLVALSDAKPDQPGQAVTSNEILQRTKHAAPSSPAQSDLITPFPPSRNTIPREISDSPTTHDGDASRTVAQKPEIPEGTGVNSPIGFNFWTTAALVISGIQVVVVAFFLIEWLVGLARLRVLKQTSCDADGSLIQIWHSMTDGCGQHVRLLVSPKIEAPLMFGWRHPVVVIPQELANVRGHELRFCLAHEWSHIERNDMLSWRYMSACQFLLWCQPLFWTLRRELRVCQDLLADDRSACSAEDAIEYSELLLTLAKRRNAPRFTGALGFLDHSAELTRRIRSLLRRKSGLQSCCGRGFSVAVASATLLAALFLGSLRIASVRAENPDQQPESSASKNEAVPVPGNLAPQLVAVLPKNGNPVANPSKPVEVEKAPQEKGGLPAAAAAPTELRYVCKVVEKGTSKGIPGARVIVRCSSLEKLAERFIQEVRYTTDAKGEYTLQIPAEQVADKHLYIRLDVEHDLYASRKGLGLSFSLFRNSETLGERPFFERIELYAAEAVTGIVLSPAGRPLAGIMVQGFSMADSRDRDSYSSVDTWTDANGQFRLNLHRGCDAVLWFISKDFGIVEKFLAKQRGDLGEIQLPTGVRVRGRVLNTAGEPLAGVAVNINSSGGRLGSLMVGSSVRRGATSDSKGEFSFDPLGAGDYRVTTADYRADPFQRDKVIYPQSLPGVFIARKLKLQADRQPEPLEFREIPHVVFSARIVDSAGKKAKVLGLYVRGDLGGEHWIGMGYSNPDGIVAVQVPRGLRNSSIRASADEYVVRYRRDGQAPLQNETHDFNWGTLDTDVSDLEIVRYQAPLVTISVVDEDQQPIKDVHVMATYPWGKQGWGEKGFPSDLYFHRLKDGRYRTFQMLPDEETTFTVIAAGYQPTSQKLNLAEGQIRELVLTLKKAADEKRAP